MNNDDDNRPNPDFLLESLRSDNELQDQGKLKIFLGYAAGVGKTYAMLDEAKEQKTNGVDVVVGYVEPHTRPETMQLLQGLPVIPPKIYPYKNIQLKEFNLDEALKRKPELVLVDELAHTNAQGTRNKKRYQDIEELLNAGIDVYTTVNIQHIESLNDVVQNITKISVRETIPDYILENAHKIKLIDIEPDELLRRLSDGKIYLPDRAISAMNNFFTKENLRLLREVAMRKAVERISHVNQNEKAMVSKMASTKMILCISCSPSSAKCIRWTARTAEMQNAAWTAVYVEKTDHQTLNEQQRKDLQLNLELAERLGAEIVTLNGDDVAAVVAEYAKLAGVSNIIIGKGRNKKTLKNLFAPDLEDRLIGLLPTVEIHIIPSNDAKKTYRMPKKKITFKNITFTWGDLLKTLGVLVAATFVSIGLKNLSIGDQNMIMVYILSVLIVSRITSGYFCGIISSVSSVLLFNFFFTEPYFTFKAIAPGYPFTFLMMLIVALITLASTVRVKTEARFAVERERRTEVLYEINKKLLVTRGLDNIVFLMNEYISKLFERSVIIYTQDPDIGPAGTLLEYPVDKDASFMLGDDERAVAHWVFINQKRAGAGTDTLMGAGAFYMPVISQGNVVGVIGLSCIKELLNQNQRAFLRRICSQLAMALERQFLSDEQRHIIIETEKEKMRSNLLRAISHDLRTPLTSIMEAGYTLRDSHETIDSNTRKTLTSNIIEDSQWLIQIVENLLSVTRILEGTTTVTKTIEAAHEIAIEAADRISKRFSNRKITIRVPEMILSVPMDRTLIKQVLLNLMENAVKHSPDDSVVEVEIKKNENNAIFEVIDYGEGLDEKDLPYLFDGYYFNSKQSSDSSRGMGVGLSICMSIIKAHHGKMEAMNKTSGGAIFRFMLPLEGEQPLNGNN